MRGRGGAKQARSRWTMVWMARAEGMGQKTIAKQLGLDQSTIRHYLRKGPPPGFNVIRVSERGVKTTPVVTPGSDTRESLAEVVQLRRAVND